MIQNYSRRALRGGRALDDDIPGDGSTVLDPPDLHAGARQGAQGRLRAGPGRLRAVAA